MKPAKGNTLYKEIKAILTEARQSAYRSVNFVMVIAYWEVGKRIVTHEQGGAKRAGYGEAVLKELSQQLTKDFGKGFSLTSLKDFRQFYLTFPETEKSHALRGQLPEQEKQKSHAVRGHLQKPSEKQKPSALPRESITDGDFLIRNALRAELGWTHYRLLMRVENEAARNYYIEEAIAQNWSTRALERQMASFYYERIVSSKKKKEVTAEAKGATDALAALPEDFIKDPYVLEFLNLSADNRFLEKDLEAAIINNLQQFILELGKGYAFVAQQKHLRAGDDFYIDLVFYNYILKCFVLIDLKLGKLTHQDIGQMDTYVRWFEENEKGSGDNPTLGIILCSEKNETIVKYSVLKDSKKLFASKYKLYLPTEQELIKEVEQGLLHYKLQHK